jgi:hypothetical protein
MYAASIIVAIFAMVLSVSAVVWLTKLIRPPKPEDEAIRRALSDVRRSRRARSHRNPRSGRWAIDGG